MFNANELEKLSDSLALIEKVGQISVADLRKEAQVHPLLQDDVFWLKHFAQYFPKKVINHVNNPFELGCYQSFIDAYDEMICKTQDKNSILPERLSPGFNQDVEFFSALAKGPHKCGSKLYYASDEIRNNEAIVGEILLKDPWWGLSAASKSIQDSVSMVVLATSVDPSAIRFASLRVRGLRPVMEPIISQENTGHLLEYASEELKDDKSFVKLAVLHSGGFSALNHATMRLRKDPELRSLADDDSKKREVLSAQQRRYERNLAKLIITHHPERFAGVAQANSGIVQDINLATEDSNVMKHSPIKE